jgi:two-component system CheB/CheR fusion protein
MTLCSANIRLLGCINEAMDIVQFHGRVLLEQSSGKPSHNLLVMAKNGLAFELRNIYINKKRKETVIKENVPIEINGSLVNITIEAIPCLILEPIA